MRQTDNSDNSAGDRIENSTTEIIWLVETWKRHETISCYIDRLSDTINPHQILHASSFFSNIEFLRTLTPYSPLKWKIIDIQWRANIFRSIFIQKKNSENLAYYVSNNISCRGNNIEYKYVYLWNESKNENKYKMVINIKLVYKNID